MLLIFDLDNTLVDRNKAFQRWISDWLFNDVNMSESVQERYLPQIVSLDNNGQSERIASFQKIIELVQAQNWNANQLWLKSAELIDFIQPDNQVLQMLKRLASHYKLALLTNGSSERQRRKIRMAGLQACFDYIAVSEEVGVAKPNDEAFKNVCRYFKLRPEKCVMIGDDEEKDIIPARTLKMKTIKITGSSKDLTTESDAKCSNVLQVEKILL